MKKIILVTGIILTMTVQNLISLNAPISTAGTITSTGTTATVPITATNFINIGTCDLKLLYDPALVSVTNVTTGPLLGGYFSLDLSVAGIIYIGWFTSPGKTLADNSVIFNIYFNKVAFGTSAITWSDNGHSCAYYDGNYDELNDIPAETYYLPGSVTFTLPIVANFTVNNTTPPKNTTVQFTDLTTNGPTSWEWSFTRSSNVIYVNSTNANSQNPQVQFTDGGLYTVTLVAHKAGLTSTKVKTDYIRAGTPGLWTGATSSVWSASTNWDNWLVPASSTNVVIPAYAPAWPLFNGDLMLGSTCNSITMNGPSEAAVTGNFTINSGYSLIIAADGKFLIGGNWTNAGNFSAGNGTIEFTGTTPASIISSGSPPVINTFYNLTVSKVGVTLTILPDIIVNGNLLIND